MKIWLAYSVGLAIVVSIAASVTLADPAHAQPFPPAGGPYAPPFTATLSNNVPLVFGMDVEDAARALGTPLNYIRGRPGDEIFLAFRDIGGSRIVHPAPPAFPAIPPRPAGRLEGRLGQELDVAVRGIPHSTLRTMINSQPNG